MRWKFTGLDKETGQPREVWVDASSRDGALSKASDLHIVVESAWEDPPFVFSQPIEVRLNKKQLKALKVTEGRIAWGVFFGLLLWAIVGVVITVIFWGLIIGGLAAAAGR